MHKGRTQLSICSAVHNRKKLTCLLGLGVMGRDGQRHRSSLNTSPAKRNKHTAQQAGNTHDTCTSESVSSSPHITPHLSSTPGRVEP